MALDVDCDLCAALLRGVTDQLAQSTTRPVAGESLPAVVGALQAINRSAVKQMRGLLDSRYPHVDWGDEEGNAGPGTSGTYWIYDPIDGAYHFTQGLPLWSASLALVSDGKTTFAAVYDPVHREMFVASAGGGATLNGTPITVSGKREAAMAVVGTAIPPIGQVGAEAQAWALAATGRVASRVFVVRLIASASLHLAFVAAGRLDGYVEGGIDANDWRAGALLVTEAGGIVTNMAGHHFDGRAPGIIAATPALKQPLLEALTF